MYQSLNARLKIAHIHASEESRRKRLDDEQAEHEQIVVSLETRDVNKDALVASVRSAG
jgi:hypothetical protein